MKEDSPKGENQTRPLPKGSHEEMDSTEFYSMIGEELEQALESS